MTASNLVFVCLVVVVLLLDDDEMPVLLSLLLRYYYQPQHMIISVFNSSIPFCFVFDFQKNECQKMVAQLEVQRTIPSPESRAGPNTIHIKKDSINTTENDNNPNVAILKFVKAVVLSYQFDCWY